MNVSNVHYLMHNTISSFPLDLYSLIQWETHVNSKKYLNVKYVDSGAYLELDVWIPNLNLCFEFQVH